MISAAPSTTGYVNGNGPYDRIFPELGHDLKIQLELYGCSNYNIEQSKYIYVKDYHFFKYFQLNYICMIQNK